MFARRSIALSALVLSFAIGGCARMPITQPLKPELLAPLQPVEVNVGIAQPELYAALARSNAGAGGAAACGAIPGIGILLAAACGGALGAVDANVNAMRAKAAEESVRPLKDALVDLPFDALMRDTVKSALETVPGMQLANTTLTKSVTPVAYEKIFRTSASNAVMFFNVDYHLSSDFSTLEVDTRGLIFPRGEAARKAAQQPSPLPAEAANEPVLDPKHAVYLINIGYRAKLPMPGSDIAANVEAWKAGDAQLLRTALKDAVAQSATLLADDLQRKHGDSSAANPKVKTASGVDADLIVQSPAGRLLRDANGSLHFEANLKEDTSTVTSAGAAARAEATAR